MDTWVSYIDQRFYPNHPEGWDDALYMDMLRQRIAPDARVLDLGAGRGANPRIALRSFAKHVCAVDVDPEVLQNPHVDEARMLEGGRIPYPDSHFDCVASSYVLEHLEKPEEVFREVFRVLRPGGYFVARTPNRFHYVPLIASMTPHWFHELVNKKRGREEHDTFPTFYRANSIASLEGLARETGFGVDSIEALDGRPEYLRFNLVTYSIGLAYERLASATEALRFLRPLLLCSFIKRSG